MAQVTISTQITPEIKEWIIEDCEDMGITQSEWLNQAIHEFIEDGSDDGALTFDDLDEMDFDELVEVVEEQELDIDPDDYSDGLLVSAQEKLRNAICDELEIKDE